MAVAARKTIENEGTIHESVRYEHDAFGKIVLNKVHSSGGVSLFGSALQHRTYVVVEVSRAHLDRKLNRDWISDVGDDNVVRFAMSEAQWAQFVSSMGVGTGTPVTLERAPARGTNIAAMPELESDPVKDTFDKEIREAGRKASESVRDVQARLSEYLKPGVKPPSKKEIENLLSELNVAGAHLSSTLGHIQVNFAEAMEKTVASAKADIEAFVSTVAMHTGLEALKNGVTPVLIENSAHGHDAE